MGIIRKEQKMQFKKDKVRVKTARGAGPDFILKQFEESYDEWAASIAEMGEEDKQELENKFNEVVEDIGTALIGDKDDFTIAKAELKGNQIKAFTDALCPEFFEVEDPEDEGA